MYRFSIPIDSITYLCYTVMSVYAERMHVLCSTIISVESLIIIVIIISVVFS